MGRKIGCEKCMKNTVVRAETAVEKAHFLRPTLVSRNMLMWECTGYIQ